MSGGEQQMLAIGRALMAQPEAAAARRAVAGHRADPRRAHLRDDRRDQQAGHDDPARRAERQLRAVGLQPRLRAGDRQGRAHRRRPPRCRPTPTSRRRTSAHDLDRSHVIGAKALYLLYAWLASAIVAAYLSDRKGYGERPGLASGLLLSVDRRRSSGWSCRPRPSRCGRRTARRHDPQGRREPASSSGSRQAGSTGTLDQRLAALARPRRDLAERQARVA